MSERRVGRRTDKSPTRVRSVYRLVPLPGSTEFRRVHGCDGDLIVIRTGGIGGTPRKIESTLRSLSLRKVGDGRIGSSSDLGFLGQIEKVKHKVRVVALANPNPRNARPTWQIGRAVVTALEHFETPSERGDLLVLEDGEYIHVERSEARVFLSWSTAAPLPTILKRALLASGVPAEGATATLTRLHDGYFEDAEATSSDLIEYLLTDEPADVVSLSMTLNNMQVYWKRPTQKTVQFPAQFGECGVVAEHLDEHVRNLLRATATPAVATSASLLLARLGFVE